MVRRSARLKNKSEGVLPSESVAACSDDEHGDLSLEELAKKAYNIIRDKARNDKGRSLGDVQEEKKKSQIPEDYISVSLPLEPRSCEIDTLASELNPGLDISNLYFKMDKSNSQPISCLDQTKVKFDEKQIMKKCVITADFEKRETAPPYHVSHNALKKHKKKEREKTAGQNWFDMAAPEITQDLQRDLNILRMRNVLDPKRHYKKNNSKKPPKYLQLGTVVSGPADFYSSRIPKRERKRTIVESLLADAEFRRYNKRKYLEIQASKMSGKKGFYRRNKRKRR